MKKVYLAGRLFNAGERLHNLYLEKHLTQIGYEVILPQREALKYFNGDGFDLAGVVNSCIKDCANEKNIFVGCVDGSDADSGTSVEYGVAIVSARRAIIYRTDFRTAFDKELGINAMFNAKGTVIIYEPCFFTELEQVDSYYHELADRIHCAISDLVTERKSV
ncbi:MAG: uroporphyrinogen III synthase HEM4 [uncultured bacterium]|nr:MAG: uroporphyrinogen III synthase HEM4 [uncultured bacterium]